jgi:hypothetical protein
MIPTALHLSICPMTDFLPSVHASSQQQYKIYFLYEFMATFWVPKDLRRDNAWNFTHKKHVLCVKYNCVTVWGSRYIYLFEIFLIITSCSFCYNIFGTPVLKWQCFEMFHTEHVLHVKCNCVTLQANKFPIVSVCLIFGQNFKNIVFDTHSPETWQKFWLRITNYKINLRM